MAESKPVRLTASEGAKLLEWLHSYLAIGRQHGVELVECQQFADRLLGDVADSWCSHCDSAPVARNALCEACDRYERRNGVLPAVEVIRKRLQRA